MSTKIYNGFQFEPADFEQVLAVVRRFRPWLQEAGCKVWEGWCQIVNKARSRPKGHPDYYAECFGSWMEARMGIKKSGERCHLVDTDFEATFFPIGGRTLLGITFAEHDSWHEEWLKQPGVSEFGYWNNTDRPDHVSAAEWRRRAKLWDKALPGVGVPAQSGFTITIANPLGPDVSKYLRKTAP